jgi:hypothetical protein
MKNNCCILLNIFLKYIKIHMIRVLMHKNNPKKKIKKIINQKKIDLKEFWAIVCVFNNIFICTSLRISIKREQIVIAIIKARKKAKINERYDL